MSRTNPSPDPAFWGGRRVLLSVLARRVCDKGDARAVSAEPLALRGVFVLRSESLVDERGEFHHVADFGELAELGAEVGVSQVSAVINTSRGTVRGMHYQVEPHGEANTLSCPDEPMFGTWVGVQLRATEPIALHVPRGLPTAARRSRTTAR